MTDIKSDFLAVHALHRNAPKIQTLILIGGPSGSGKTTLSNALLGEGGVSLGIEYERPCLRTDARSLRHKNFPGGSLIVEYATTSLLSHSDQILMFDEIDHLIERSKKVHFVTLEVGRVALLKQYIGRFRSERLRRTPTVLRYFRLRKWRQVLSYIFLSDVRKSYALWTGVQCVMQRYDHVDSRKVSFDGRDRILIKDPA